VGQRDSLRIRSLTYSRSSFRSKRTKQAMRSAVYTMLQHSPVRSLFAKTFKDSYERIWRSPTVVD